MLLFDDIAAEYRDFAAYARADSPTFEAWASAVAADDEVIEWLAALPAIKHQPNLVFAAARFHGVPAPGEYQGLRDALLGGPSEQIKQTILTHATQTNEVGRLATLLPVFAQIEGPLALLEVGASAGLCLYPDRWSYAWQREADVVRLGDASGVLHARVKGEVPLPTQLPQVTWRGGVDLNPLSVQNTAHMAWLEMLVWPEHQDRRERLRHAIEIARREPPAIVRGDLLDVLPDLVAEATAFGTVVVFHSAVIAYLEPAQRQQFEQMMRALVARGACRWVSNEGKNVLPAVTATGPAIPETKQTFVLGLDGQAIAHTHGHGRFLRSW